jgi:hypothetical protein
MTEKPQEVRKADKVGIRQLIAQLGEAISRHKNRERYSVNVDALRILENHHEDNEKKPMIERIYAAHKRLTKGQR